MAKKKSRRRVSRKISKIPVHSETLVRLRRASGHLAKVIKMVEAGSDSVDVLQQLSAVVAALAGCRAVLFNGHLKAKLRSALRGGNEPLIDEIEKLASRVLRA